MPAVPLSRLLQIEASAVAGDEGFVWACSPVSIPIASETAGLCGVQVVCPKGVEFSKGGLSRISVGFPFFNGNNGLATSPRFDLEFWALIGGVATLIATVDLPPFTWGSSGPGPVCGIQGILAEGFEIRARVPAAGVGACEILTRARLVVDRAAGGVPGAWAVPGAAVSAAVTFTGF